MFPFQGPFLTPRCKTADLFLANLQSRAETRVTPRGTPYTLYQGTMIYCLHKDLQNWKNKLTLMTVRLITNLYDMKSSNDDHAHLMNAIFEMESMCTIAVFRETKWWFPTDVWFSSIAFSAADKKQDEGTTIKPYRETKVRSILHRSRFEAISLFSIVLMWSATKTTAQTYKEELRHKDNQMGLSGETNAVIFAVFMLALSGMVYLCISWTCCFEHEMIYSDDQGCCPSDRLRQLNNENNENNTVHLTENIVDVV